MKNGWDKAGKFICRSSNSISPYEEIYISAERLHPARDMHYFPIYQLFHVTTEVSRIFSVHIYGSINGLGTHRSILRAAEDPIKRGSTKGVRYRRQMLSKTRRSDVRRSVCIYENEHWGINYTINRFVTCV